MYFWRLDAKSKLLYIAHIISAMLCSANYADTSYDFSIDPFYNKEKINLTWIMIWNGSTEKHWWEPTDYNGCQININNKSQSINWNDKEHIEKYCTDIRDAGINVIISDLTNGFRWKWQSKYVQQFCQNNDMKFMIAFNPDAGKKMEINCKTIWDEYACPEATNSSAYFYKDGKPLLILYTWRQGYTDSINQTGLYRKKFSTVWASGEDSNINKWGWQLEPHIGPVPSNEAMFITSSVKFNSPQTSNEMWRKNLSWLDYGFIIARRNHPKYLIIGSFDDFSERNSWMAADTQKAHWGWQMRDKNGCISHDAYYNRVCEWLLKNKPKTIEGGLIPDGAYLVKYSDGRVLSVKENKSPESPAILNPFSDNINNYIWFYHLGNNVYRIIKLNAAMPFESANSTVFINSDNASPAQKWIVKKDTNGYLFINLLSNESLSYSQGKIVTKIVNEKSTRWLLINKASIQDYWDKFKNDNSKSN